MPILYLLRHAEAAASLTGDDDARPLSAKGQAQASWLGNWFQHKGITVSAVLCSPAKRTRETLAALNFTAPVDFPNLLYLAEAHAMLSVLSIQDAESVLLVGHNPGLHLLALDLCHHDTAKAGGLEFGFPAAGLAIYNVDSWKDITGPATHLKEFITPGI